MLDPNTADGIELMLKRTGGVRIQLGDDETWGHFEILDEVVLSHAEVIVGAPSILIATGKLTMVEMDAELIIERDGELEAWSVRLPQRIDDGRMTRVLLKEV